MVWAQAELVAEVSCYLALTTSHHHPVGRMSHCQKQLLLVLVHTKNQKAIFQCCECSTVAAQPVLVAVEHLKAEKAPSHETIPKHQMDCVHLEDTPYFPLELETRRVSQQLQQDPIVCQRSEALCLGFWSLQFGRQGQQQPVRLRTQTIYPRSHQKVTSAVQQAASLQG